MDGRTAAVVLGIAAGIIGVVGWNVWTSYGGIAAIASMIGILLAWQAVCKTAKWLGERKMAPP
jgi:hypothetical protein